MTVWPEGVGRRILASVDSTLSEAARQAATATGPVWILAYEQTAARGRRGRPWKMPPGNFSATLLMQPGDAESAALRSFVSALALYDAFVAATDRPELFALKWPNDVLLNGGKVAGILLESSGTTLAIGIGVNLIAAPPASAVEPGAVTPVSLLQETGLRLAPEAFLNALAPAYAAREAAFRQGGFAALRPDWLAHAARLGEVIRARTGTDTREGVFDTVDAAGNLILRQKDATLAIPAAEVFF